MTKTSRAICHRNYRRSHFWSDPLVWVVYGFAVYYMKLSQKFALRSGWNASWWAAAGGWGIENCSTCTGQFMCDIFKVTSHNQIWLVWLPFLAFSHRLGINNHPNWLSYFSEGFKPPTRNGFHWFPVYMQSPKWNPSRWLLWLLHPHFAPQSSPQKSLPEGPSIRGSSVWCPFPIWSTLINAISDMLG